MSPNDALRIAICGLGARGLEHARAIQQLDALSLRGVFDVAPGARLAASKALGVPAFADLGEMLSACEPHIVVIATPPSERFSLVEQIAAAKSVRAILIEKPLAINLAEARRIFALCNARGLVLRIGHQLRFSPEFVQLKHAVDAGELGELRSVDASCFGNLLDQGPHMVDLVCWLLAGQRPRSVEAQAHNDLAAIARQAPIPPEFVPSRSHPAPYSVTASIEFDGGVRAAVTAGLLAPMTRPDLGPWMQKRVRVEGTRASAEAHVGSHFSITDPSHPEVLTTPSSLEAFTDATRRMHIELAETLRSTAELQMVPEEYEVETQLLFGSLHSSLTGESMRFPLGPEAKLEAGSGRIAPVAIPVAPASGSPWSGPPRLSAIVSMAEHRGLGLRTIAAWADQQRCDPRLYEILLILDERVSPELAAEIRARLRPWDRCLQAQTLVETEQYVMAARQAQGEYFFFAEAHVLPEPQAVEEAIHFLDTQNYAGLCVRSSPVPGNRFSHNEDRQLSEQFVEWSKPGNFAKVFARGFCVRASVYWEIGGHQYRYHRFADAIMAAELKQRGYEVAYVPAVGVRHLDEQEFSGLDYSINNFVTGEALWRHKGSARITKLFFGEPPEWIEARAFRPGLVRQFCRILLQEIVRLGQGLSPSFRVLGGPREFLRLLPQALLGGGALLLREDLRRLGCRLRYYLAAFDGEARFRAYTDWYAAEAAFYRVKFALQHPPQRDVEPGQVLVYPAEAMTSSEVAGFHALETHQGIAFRWTGTIAALRVRAERAAYQLVLETNGVRRARGRHVALYLDRTRLGPLEFNEDSTSIRVHFPGAAFDATQEHWLTIVCPPLREAGVHGPNRRSLGLPITRVTLIAGSEPARA